MNSLRFQDAVQNGIRSTLESIPEGRDVYQKYLQVNQPRVVADAKYILAKCPTRGRMLDIGGTPPLLGSILANSGFEKVVVTDPFVARFHTQALPANLELVPWSFGSEVPENLREQFDIVTCCEVIEHLPGDILTECRRMIQFVKPGGLLLVTTPNLRSLSGLFAVAVAGSGLASKPWNSVKAQFDRASGEYGYYGHIREFTNKEIKNLFRDLGVRYVGARYQAEYRWKHPVRIWFYGFERVFLPSWRLFGKYLFEKQLTEPAE